ncbi:MAG: hypothetical protein EBU90_03005 [Proteobacteria bacterium]|nr:hypothetical protein [Pseudomonadota bacterium]
MAGKIAAETLNETMWVVYYAICKKSSNFVIRGTNIDANYWIDVFGSKDKLKGFLKKFGLESDLEEFSYEIRDIDSKMDATYAKSFFVSNDWHNALKSQVQNFLKNSKVGFTKNLDIIRQDGFYKVSGLEEFLKKIWNVFQFRGTFDRWNPSDVWFYDASSIREIKAYLKTTSVYNREVILLSQRVQKNYALEDVVGLNRLFVKLYEEKKLAPISLKKATSTKGVYSSRIGLVNVPQDDMGRPTPPKVTATQLPIKPYPKDYVAGGLSGSGGKDLKYDIEIDQVILDENGRKKYVREYDYVGYNAKGKTLGVKKERQFSQAQGGSLGLDIAEKVLYTAQGSREIKKVRDEVFKSSLSADMLSKGEMKGKDRDAQFSNALDYIQRMCEELEPSVKNKSIRFARTDANNNRELKNKDAYIEAQNKLEIAMAIEKSGVPDEIVLDLWKAITSKGITNRKDYERLIERIGKSKYEQSRKKGQKRLTQQQADEAAAQSLRATIVGSASKVPGSFHLKLY